MRKALSVVFGAILGVAFFIPTAVFADSVIDSVNSNSTTDVSLGTAGGYSIWWSYVPGASHNICSIDLVMRAHGAPTDSVKIDLLIGSSTTRAFGHDPIADATQLASPNQWQIRSTVYATYTFTFSPCAVVVGASSYQIHLDRTGTYSSTNYYELQGTQTAGSVNTGTAAWGFDFLFGNTFHALANAAWDISINGTENFGVVSPNTTPTFGQSVINTLLGINESNATTTTASTTASFVNVPAYFAARVPWGYLFAIRDAYAAAATTSTEYAALTVNFGTSGMSTSARSWLPSTLTLFSTSTVTTYLNGSLLAAGNTLAAAVAWVAMIAYWFRRTMTV